MSHLKLKDFIQEQEKHYLLILLEWNKWQIGRTAEAAGISRKSLWKKMKDYGIKTPYRLPSA